MRRSMVGIGVLAFVVVAAAPLDAASGFANPAFEQQWKQSEAVVPNFWGPLATAKDGQQEPYKEAPGGTRLVQYFDKARMELTNPSAGLVTNGLLTVEMKTGQVQVGDNTFQAREPARINIAGDPGADGVTYADLARLPERDTPRDNPDSRPPLGIIGGQFAPVQNLPVPNIPTSGGPFYAPFTQDPGGRYAQYVFKPFADFIAALPQGLGSIGYPITPVILVQVKIAGTPTYVLAQAFERRVLTFNGANPAATRVEFGNIGQHYATWRASLPAPAATTPTPPTTTAPASGTVSSAASPLTFISVQGAAPGNKASAAIQGPPSSVCSLSFITPQGGVSGASGLGAKTTTSAGVAGWTWNIDSNAKTGTGTLTAQCGTVTATATIKIG